MMTEIVMERENKIIEYMKTMGMINGAYWLSWFIITFIMTLGPVLILGGVSFL